MSERVVDLFETIQVEKRHGQQLAMALCLGDELSQQSTEEAAIGKRGERVVVSQVFHLFGMLYLGLRLSTPGLRELPAQAPQHTTEHQYEGATERRALHILAHFMASSRQLLALPQSYDHR